jgi:hypothetical protein
MAGLRNFLHILFVLAAQAAFLQVKFPEAFGIRHENVRVEQGGAELLVGLLFEHLGITRSA